MIYCDDILNVNAYLRSKSRVNIEKSRMLVKEYQRLNKSYDELLGQADALLRKINQFANSIGIIADQQSNPIASRNAEDCIDCTDLLIKLPKDIDFFVEFERLSKEAQAHGYTDVHPEDLLSSKEIQHANEFSNQLDERFKQETGLTSKDITVLFVATAIRVSCYYLFSHVMSSDEVHEDHKANEDAKLNTEYPVDTMSDMDLVSLVNSARDMPSAISQSREMAHLFRAGKPKSAVIKLNNQIIADTIPFDIPDNDFFRHNDVLGFDSILGWIFGVMNIMTDTVTTRKMESFSVSRVMGTSEAPRITRRISTPLHLIYPIVTHMPKHKESFLAAVVREAQVLNVAKGSSDDLRRILRRTMEIEEKNRLVIDGVENSSGFDLSIKEIAVHLAHTAFINQLITAVHAIQYDPTTDGDITTYAIRTNKILTISNGIAALLDSIPVLVVQDISKLDFAGIISACQSLFCSTKFWIEVKTNYLVSEYKVKIDKELKRIDHFFETELL